MACAKANTEYANSFKYTNFNTLYLAICQEWYVCAVHTPTRQPSTFNESEPLVREGKEGQGKGKLWYCVTDRQRRPEEVAGERPGTMSAREKRETKAVEAFVPQEVKEKAEFVIKPGSGTKLGDIENVKLKMDKLNAGGEELKALHRICFGRPGEKTKIKRNLREFSGMDDDEAAKKQPSVAKLDGKLIKALLTTCDLSTSGTKAQNVDALLDWLKSPSESGKKSLSEKAAEKKKAAERKKLKKEKAKGKGKRKASGGVPGLKRPLNAFMLYCNNKRDKVRAENPEASVAEIGKILGEKWRGISAERKANYEAQAKELKAEYEAKLAAMEGGPSKKKQKVSKDAEDEDDEDEDEDEDDEEEGDDEEGEGDAEEEEEAKEEEAKEEEAKEEEAKEDE